MHDEASQNRGSAYRMGVGGVSLLRDVSNEMIRAVLPLFMAGTLGAGAVWIGLVEEIGEAASGSDAGRFCRAYRPRSTAE